MPMGALMPNDSVSAIIGRLQPFMAISGPGIGELTPSARNLLSGLALAHSPKARPHATKSHVLF